MAVQHSGASKRKQRKTKVRRNRRFMHWVAMGAVATYTGLGRHTPIFAQTQDRQGGSESRQSAKQFPALPLRRFDIPPSPLGEALDRFHAVTGRVVEFSNETIRAWPSPGISGVLSDEQALQALLKGSGITYSINGAGKVVLIAPVLNTAVEVTAAAPVMSSPKFTESATNTPQTIAVVPRQIMDDQATTTLRDALRNVAGISLAAGEGGSQGDNLTIRGFTARNDIFMDGMRDFGSYYRDPFNLDQVEVLEGPSGVTFGRGSTGGVVEQDTKAAEPGRHFLAGDIEVGTDLTRRMTLDWNMPLTALGAGDAFRLNLMGDEGNVADRDVAENRRFGVAPSLSFGLDGPTRLTLSYLHEAEDDIPDYGIPWFFNGPAPVPRQNYYGFANGNFLRTDVDMGTAKLEHDVNATVSVRDQLRYAHYHRDVLITEPQVDALSTLGTPTTPSTPLSEIIVDRHQIGADSVETFLWDQLDATAHASRGALRTTLVMGMEGGQETSDPTRPTDTNVPTTSLLDPNPNQPFSATSTITSVVKASALSFGAYALDTLWIGSRWELTGGARWDRFGSNYSQFVAPASAFQRVDQMPTWRAAIVYKPRPAGSIYFDYGTSFNPSAESLSLSAATANLAPETNKTYELGSKWDLLQGGLSLRGSIFRTDKTNAREPSPDNPLLDVLAGNELVNGVQFDLTGSLADHTAVTAGYAYLDSAVVSSQFYPASIGFPLANVPKQTFHAWITHPMPWHLTLGAGSDYVGSRTASSTVPLDPTTDLIKQVPGYWIFNAMGKMPIDEQVSLQVNVDNLANRYYYDEIHPGHIVPGAGRTLTVGFHFKF